MTDNVLTAQFSAAERRRIHNAAIASFILSAATGFGALVLLCNKHPLLALAYTAMSIFAFAVSGAGMSKLMNGHPDGTTDMYYVPKKRKP